MKDGPKVKDFCLQIPDVISLHILAFTGEKSVVSIEDWLRQFCEKSWGEEDLSSQINIS